MAILNSRRHGARRAAWKVWLRATPFRSACAAPIPFRAEELRGAGRRLRAAGRRRRFISAPSIRRRRGCSPRSPSCQGRWSARWRWIIPKSARPTIATRARDGSRARADRPSRRPPRQWRPRQGGGDAGRTGLHRCAARWARRSPSTRLPWRRIVVEKTGTPPQAARPHLDADMLDRWPADPPHCSRI